MACVRLVRNDVMACKLRYAADAGVLYFLRSYYLNSHTGKTPVIIYCFNLQNVSNVSEMYSPPVIFGETGGKT